MKKYLIAWDYGYGEEYEVIEADSYDEALEIAHAYWQDGAESQAYYDAKELTKELAEDYDEEYEDDNTE